MSWIIIKFSLTRVMNHSMMLDKWSYWWELVWKTKLTIHSKRKVLASLKQHVSVFFSFKKFSHKGMRKFPFQRNSYTKISLPKKLKRIWSSEKCYKGMRFFSHTFKGRKNTLELINLSDKDWDSESWMVVRVLRSSKLIMKKVYV